MSPSLPPRLSADQLRELLNRFVGDGAQLAVMLRVVFGPRGNEAGTLGADSSLKESGTTPRKIIFLDAKTRLTRTR